MQELNMQAKVYLLNQYQTPITVTPEEGKSCNLDMMGLEGLVC
jgi:hypothetical protein